jgi:hypothetical protein
MIAVGSNETAGIGDPYWYEWSVGLMHVLNMLDPVNGIKSVTIQADELQGLDDVIVDYHDGRRRCIQVKHTREAASITFGDLVAEGLLKALALPWQQALHAGRPCTAELYKPRCRPTSMDAARWRARSPRARRLLAASEARIAGARHARRDRDAC